MTTQAIPSFPATREALKSAHACADEILPNPRIIQPSGSNSPHTVVHNHYHNDSWGWNSFWFRPYYQSPVIIDAGCSRPSRSRDDKRDDNTGIAVAATLIGLATTYFFGQNLAQWKNADDKIAATEEKKYQVRYELAQNRELSAQVQTVIMDELNILQEQKQDAEVGLMSKAGLMAGCGTAFAGALAASSLLVTAGTVVSIFSLTAMALRAGFNAVSSQETKALHLKEAITRAEQTLAEIAPKA